MCDPVTLAAGTFAVGAAQAVTGYVGQSRMAATNAANAQQATAINYSNTQLRMQQDRAAASQQLFQNRIETLKAESTAQTAAGEAGVHGLSVDALMRDFAGRQGRYADAVDQNYQMSRQSLVGEMDAQRARGQSQINSVARPSLLDAGLRITSSGLQSGAGYLNMTRPR